MKSHTHIGIWIFIILVILCADNVDKKIKLRVEALENKIESLQKAQPLKGGEK